MRIEIEIPRPRLTFLLIAGVVGFVAWNGWSPQQPLAADAAGGTDVPSAQVVVDAEDDVKQARLERALVERREEILRFEIITLEDGLRRARLEEKPELEQRYIDGIRELVSLLQQKQRAEETMLASFREMWEAQGHALALGRTLYPSKAIARLLWPVDAVYGISAGFLDAAYEERFGMPHNAIDIPVEQGTEVLAAADGVVEEVNDNGLGFNSVIIRHDGFVTLYGHVESFLVAEGDEVSAGQPIALSGGMPGTAGAGHLTTGPHLHLEVIVDGAHVDPMEYLSGLEEDEASL